MFDLFPQSGLKLCFAIETDLVDTTYQHLEARVVRLGREPVFIPVRQGNIGDCQGFSKIFRMLNDFLGTAGRLTGNETYPWASPKPQLVRRPYLSSLRPAVLRSHKIWAFTLQKEPHTLSTLHFLTRDRIDDLRLTAHTSSHLERSTETKKNGKER
ncbi:hypothetical protein J6590_066757 [Homalodisca vitripennis]|nr:hypothetical protein J6590_066757 [Homalodisca vitripennis]